MAAPIIHGERLLNGDRLSRCSARAQLFYPRILLCCNGYGRIEIDPRRIIDFAFRTFREDRPSEDEIVDVLEEYAKNYLLLFYHGRGGQLWGQFDIPDNLLPEHKTKPDQQSPAPPQGDMEAMRSAWEEVKRQKSNAVNRLRAIVNSGEPKSLKALENPGNDFQLLAKEVVGEVVVEEKKKNKRQAPAVLPDWLPLEPWNAFVEMRSKGKGKPLTEYGKKLIIADLERFRSRGHPPGPILEEAVKRGWTGVWEPKDSTDKPKGAKVFEDAFERRIKANCAKLPQ
jgi:hypothetical protein